MNKYKVKINRIFSEVMDIEAANEDEARENAKTKEEGTNIITPYIEVPGVEE